MREELADVFGYLLGRGERLDPEAVMLTVVPSRVTGDGEEGKTLYMAKLTVEDAAANVEQLKEILASRRWFTIAEHHDRDAMFEDGGLFEGGVVVIGTWSLDTACELLPVEAWLDSEAHRHDD